MMSGMRNDPPISTSCPRETITSRPAARAVSIEQHGGGVVVHHHGRLGAGQAAEQRLDVVVAGAPLARLQVVLQGAVGAGHLQDALHGGLGQQGPAQVGVHHDAAWR